MLSDIINPHSNGSLTLELLAKLEVALEVGQALSPAFMKELSTPKGATLACGLVCGNLEEWVIQCERNPKAVVETFSMIMEQSGFTRLNEMYTSSGDNTQTDDSSQLMEELVLRIVKLFRMPISEVARLTPLQLMILLSYDHEKGIIKNSNKGLSIEGAMKEIAKRLAKEKNIDG